MKPAAFFDRDGVLNVDRGYTHKIDDLELIPGAAAAVGLLNRAGYHVVVVTNQSGVARGYYPAASVEQFNEHLNEALKAEGARIDAFYYCPHHPDGSIKELAIQCRCRKPGTGLLEQAARDRSIDLKRSFLIGDKDDDLAAANAFHIAGIKFDPRADSLLELVRKQIEKNGAR